MRLDRAHGRNDFTCINKGMTVAILYRWRLKPGREGDFRRAWEEATRLIHQNCASYGACLHDGEDGLVWSYALWPSEAQRQACFSGRDWLEIECFQVMQSAIAERYDEVRLKISSDLIAMRGRALDVPVLESERLILRPLQIEDAEALFAALGDEASMTYWSRPALESLDEVRSYMRWNIAGEGVQTFAITRKGAIETALGWVVLIDNKPGTAELGYILVPGARGEGIAREACQRVMTYATSARQLRRVFADIDPDNQASIHLVEALGFEREGRFKAAWETHLGVRDSLIFGFVPETSPEPDVGS